MPRCYYRGSRQANLSARAALMLDARRTGVVLPLRALSRVRGERRSAGALAVLRGAEMCVAATLLCVCVASALLSVGCHACVG